MKFKTSIIVDDLAWIKTDTAQIGKFVDNLKSILKDYDTFFANLNNLENKAGLTFDTAINSKQTFQNKIGEMFAVLNVYEMMHTDEKTRDLSRDVSLKMSELTNSFNFNPNIYEVFKKYFNGNYKKEKKSLTLEQIKIVENLKKYYKRSGFELPQKQKDRIVELSNIGSELATYYEKDVVLMQEKGIFFTREELGGVPENFLGNLKKENDKFFVTVRNNHLEIVTKYATKRETRVKIIDLSREGAVINGKDNNSDRLVKMLQVRAEYTKILGFKTFTDMATDEQILSGGAKVSKFLEDLHEKLIPIKKDEIKKLEKVAKSIGEKLDVYNLSYVTRIYNEKENNLDENKFKEYFEVENTLSSMFLIFKSLFDVEFVKKDFAKLHSDVRVYEVKDVKTNEVLATTVFDLFPREGKYSHACVSTPKLRYRDLNGNVHTTTSFLVTNFNKNENGATLLSLTELNTLFHEAGHLIHAILSDNNFKSTSWNNTSTDFVEIPSQTIEKFGATKEGLYFLSKHFKTGEKLSVDLFNSFKKSKKETAMMWDRQVSLSLFDQTIHGSKIKTFNNAKKLKDLNSKIAKKYTGISFKTPSNMPSNFGHLMHGYEAVYYSYIVSKIYADDVYGELEKSLINKKGEIVLKKNKTVNELKLMLQTGSKEKEMIMLKRFLKRAPKNSAFINNIKK